MTLTSFCNGLTLFCGIALVTATGWVFLAERARRRRANGLWAAFCLEKGWGFTPYAVSWRGAVFPSVSGSWRGRPFSMHVENSYPLVRVMGAKTGKCGFGFMLKSKLREMNGKGRRHAIPEDGLESFADADDRFVIAASSRRLAESILEHAQLRQRMRRLLDRECRILGLNDEGACSASIDWHDVTPDVAEQVLDVLCDMADAAELTGTG